MSRWRAARPSAGRWALAAGWYAVICGLSQARGTDSETTRSWLDLVALGDLNGLLRMAAHGFLFGVQAVLVWRALAVDGRWRDERLAASAALGITLALALADEAHQHFVPLRHGRLVDVAFDVLGAALGLAAALWLRRARRGISG